MTDMLETELSNFDNILQSKVFSESQKKSWAILALRNNLLTNKEHVRYAVEAAMEKKQYKTAVAAGLEQLGYKQTLEILNAKKEYSTAARLARDQQDFATASTFYELAGRFDRAIDMSIKAGNNHGARTLFERALAMRLDDILEAITNGDTSLAANYAFQLGRLCQKSGEFEAAREHFDRSRRYFEIAGNENGAYDAARLLEDAEKQILIQSAQSEISDE